MYAELKGCSAAISDFHESCFPMIRNEFLDFPRTIENIRNGKCSIKNLYDLFVRCVPSGLKSVYFGQSSCYDNKESFLDCLPGAAHSKKLELTRCQLLSLLVFFSNESTTFLSSALKPVSIFVTYMIRRLETENCLKSCAEHTFKFLGPNEFPLEYARYTVSAVHNLASYVALIISLYFPSSIPAKVGLAFASTLSIDAINKFTQIFSALPQQKMRNLDFTLAYKKCAQKKNKSRDQTKCPRPAFPSPVQVPLKETGVGFRVGAISKEKCAQKKNKSRDQTKCPCPAFPPPVQVPLKETGVGFRVGAISNLDYVDISTCIAPWVNTSNTGHLHPPATYPETALTQTLDYPSDIEPMPIPDPVLNSTKDAQGLNASSNDLNSTNLDNLSGMTNFFNVTDQESNRAREIELREIIGGIYAASALEEADRKINFFSVDPIGSLFTQSVVTHPCYKEKERMAECFKRRIRATYTSYSSFKKDWDFWSSTLPKQDHLFGLAVIDNTYNAIKAIDGFPSICKSSRCCS